MAEIDKSLPNVKQSINIPSPEELEVELQEEQQDPDQPIDVQQNEDGSVDINFDPSIGSQEQGEDHFANLAELLPEEVLAPIGHELYENFTDYKASRKDWETSYTKGLDLLGFKYEETQNHLKVHRCSSPSISRSGYTVSIISLQRIITIRWTS